MPLGVTSYDFSLFLHITAATIGLGVTFAEGLIYPVTMRLDPRYLPLKHRLQLAINVLLALPGLVVVAATGMYQVSEAGFELGDFWLSATLTIVIVLALMLVAYFIPEDRRLQAMSSATSPPPGAARWPFRPSTAGGCTSRAPRESSPTYW